MLFNVAQPARVAGGCACCHKTWLSLTPASSGIAAGNAVTNAVYMGSATTLKKPGCRVHQAKHLLSANKPFQRETNSATAMTVRALMTRSSITASNTAAAAAT